MKQIKEWIIAFSLAVGIICLVLTPMVIHALGFPAIALCVTLVYVLILATSGIKNAIFE